MKTVTLIPGDGIGPEIAKATKSVVLKAGAEIAFEEVNAGEAVYQEKGELIPQEVYDSLEKNRIALKGPITTPVGKGFKSINVYLRKKYDLFSNIRPIRSLNGVKTLHRGVDMVIFRENTEGLYIGEEKEIEGGFEAIKRITEKWSERIIADAFRYAEKEERKSVAVVHKANILKKTDGLFLETARKVAARYPAISLKEVIVDNMCMQMATDPNQFDVVVTMNLYGDIISDLGAGLVGGLGVTPGLNRGENMAVFEAVHGSAPDIAGQNRANPLALIQSAVMLLDHIEQREAANRLRTTLEKTLPVVRTRDLGGQATTSEFAEALIENMEA